MWFLAWRNASRRKSQSLLTISITMLTIFTFVVILLVFSAVQSSLELSASRLGADVIILPNQSEDSDYQTIFTADPSNYYMKRELINDFAKVKGVSQITSQFYTQTLNEDCCSMGYEMRLVGYDPKTDFILAPWFASQNKSSLAENEMITGANVGSFLGNRSLLLGKIFTVVGKLEATGSGMDETTFINIDTARRIAANSKFLKRLWVDNSPDELISSVLIRVDANSQPKDVVKAIRKLRLPVRVFATGNLVSSLRNQIGTLQKIVLGLWLALLVIAALALIGRFAALAKERKKEIGLLRALGVQETGVFRLIILEAGILAGTGGLLGSVFGIIAANPIFNILKSSLELPVVHWSISEMLINGSWGLILALLMGLAASVYPAWRSAAGNPQETMARGELD